MFILLIILPCVFSKEGYVKQLVYENLSPLHEMLTLDPTVPGSDVCVRFSFRIRA